MSENFSAASSPYQSNVLGQSLAQNAEQQQPNYRSLMGPVRKPEGQAALDEWAMLARFKDLKEKQRELEEQRAIRMKQQHFKLSLDTQHDKRVQNSMLKKTLDKQIENNMLVYDQMMHEKYMQEEGKRAVESRRKRREMETRELS